MKESKQQTANSKQQTANSKQQTVVRFLKLNEICSFEYGKPLKEKDRKKGNYPVMGSNGIVGYHDEYLIKSPCIIVGRKGSAGAINWVDKNCYPIDTTFYIQLKTNTVNLKYLFYYLTNTGLTSVTQSSGVPGLNRNVVYLKSIPVPPLAEQERIVSILDRFEALTTDITIGLPAEIAARKKQYEYYRDKLLTFKKVA